MSNLVTPMLTSVESSTGVDFYPSSIRFANSPCAIINKRSDKIFINDPSEWNDLDHLVGRSDLFKTSTPIKGYNVPSSHNRRIFSNNLISNDNAKIQDLKQSINDRLQSNNISNIEHSKVINNNWNISASENNSCSKACVNVNMGYNEGSSLESMVSNKKTKIKEDLHQCKHTVENSGVKLLDPSSITAVVNAASKAIDTNPKTLFLPPMQSSSHNNDQVKTFKNGAKSGHSRQWGSCGSPGMLQMQFEDKFVKSKMSQELKPLTDLNKSFDSTDVSPTKLTTEVRPKSNSQTNRLKRISQVSFEAEFDSEGRTHEQTIIDLRKINPYTMAGQITQIELSYFKAIKPEEFLTFKWTGLSKHIHAPSIVASTRWFNQLNFWAQRIILECTEIHRRTEMLVYLIRIIKKLVENYNNLSSGMALMSALEVECIFRLKQTWNNLSNKDRATFRRMEELFSSENNYEKLREHINSLKLPCIPYLGLYLTDLTYINIAHSKISEFESQTKTDQINNILRTVSEFQQSEYDIHQTPILYRYLESQRYIEELQKIIEENNYRSSLLLEPNTAEYVSQQTRQQQQDFPTFHSISPQKSPPSYACQHVPIMTSLQSPISPKLMTSLPHNESINEVPEQQQVEHQLTMICDDNNQESATNDECGDDATNMTAIHNDSSMVAADQDGNKPANIDQSMLSSRYLDDDSVKVSLLCGTARKSHFKKSKKTNSSLHFKRDSSVSSRQRIPSKTTTISSTSQSDIDPLSKQHSKSLLDDSYLDARTLTDTCSGPGVVDADRKPIGVGDIALVSNQQMESLCSPPICRCLIKGDVVDLKPKASTKRKTEYSNLVNIAHAAETAVGLSEKNQFYYQSDSDIEQEHPVDESQNSECRDVFKLVCQGVLSRKLCIKNTKVSLFAMWNRHWMVLLMSRTNAFLVFFENSQFRSLERKDFKSKKCHVQDLRRVTVSRVRPTRQESISEHKVVSNDNDSDISDNDHTNNDNDLKKFFLIDKEYGTVYKFHDPNIKSKPTSHATNDDAHHPSVNNQMPSLSNWYHLLKHTIKRLHNTNDDNKDLIVLGDS